MAKRVLAIDIGGSKLMAAVVETDGTILDSRKMKLPSGTTEYEILSYIERMAEELRQGKPVEAAGVNIPGLADPGRGLWVYACFSGIRDFPIAELLRARLGLDIFIENDANACALAERRFGVCRNTSDYLWITVSNGVGGGLVLGGRLYRGYYGSAAEVGHICVEEGGLPCSCGNLGCLEAQAAGPGISRSFALLNGGDLDAAAIAALARQGEPAALRVFEDTGRYLGKAASYALNLLNLQKIVVGGGVAGSFELFYPQMMKTATELVFRDANRHFTIEKTGLGYEAALLGAATTALDGIGRMAK